MSIDTKPVPEWMGAACTCCGKCCTNSTFMTTLQVERSDVERWEDEGREDILRFVQPAGDGMFDVWIDEKGVERERCPFVRKDRNRDTYRCTIYETRPEVCRQFPREYGHMVFVGCEILDVLIDTAKDAKTAKRRRR